MHFTRLLFAMRPWYSREPRQLGGARVLSVCDPIAVSRAYGLVMLLETPDAAGEQPVAVPEWVSRHAPWLGRFWGEGLIKTETMAFNERVREWSRTDPAGLVAAGATSPRAKQSVATKAPTDCAALMTTNRAGKPSSARQARLKDLLTARPAGLVEGAEILNAHRDEVMAVLARKGYSDPEWIGGYLDRDLPQ